MPATWQKTVDLADGPPETVVQRAIFEFAGVLSCGRYLLLQHILNSDLIEFPELANRQRVLFESGEKNEENALPLLWARNRHVVERRL